MKQSDILSFAINGVRREVEDGVEEVRRLQSVLAELLEMDKQEPEPAVGRPEGFKYEPLVVCSSCKMVPCVCGDKL